MTFPSSLLRFGLLFLPLGAGSAHAGSSHPWPAEPSTPVVVEFVVERGERALLIGHGFTSTEDTRVSFGPLEAELVRVIDDSRLEIRLPAGAGRVDVCVSNANGASILAEGYEYPPVDGERAERSDTPAHECWPYGTLTDAPLAGDDSLDPLPEYLPAENELFLAQEEG